MPKTRYISICILSLLFLFTSCSRGTVPKEYGYFRINLPSSHHYAQALLDGYPYVFDLSEQAVIQPINSQGENYWIDIVYPQWNAVVHCSYKQVRNNLASLSKDAQEFVYSHAIKATAIPEREYMDPMNQVYGLSFDLQGNTASVMQFYLTDSTRHFFRGSLYFNTIPNQDSIQPVADFIREDMIHLIESFRWQESK